MSSNTVEDDSDNWKFVAAQNDKPAYYLYNLEIQKSANDDREYRIVRLENGLEAVLVHDEKTDKAAASLNVTVGHFSDPEDIPGLAHFCEHLLFMGTKQFPKENEFTEYLTKNDGGTNAFTGGDDTTYYFSVASGALKGALERFSTFFHSPEFSESCTIREAKAVDSENSLYQQDDDWRIEQLLCHLARPGHPLRKFGIGNKKTLLQTARLRKSRPKKEPPSNRSPADTRSKGERNSSSDESTKDEESPEYAAGMETRRRLMEWWRKEYGAERMSLVVVGKDTLDELTQLVAEFFTPIKNRGQDPLPRLPKNPFEKDQLSTVVYAKTIMDNNTVTIIFPINDQTGLWRVKPAEFLAHLIEHEGSGSLHAYLKNKGWLSSLEARSEELARGVYSFQLSVDLTKEGLKNYQEVIKACFKYISLLKSSALPKWFQEEIITLNALEFQFDEKVPAYQHAVSIVGSMQLPIPRALILSGPRLTWGWDEELVLRTLSKLNVKNSLIIISSQDLSIIGKNGPWSKEPWYGTQYILEKLDEQIVVAAQAPNDISEIFLPKPNEFIPTNIDVEKIEVSQPRKRPSLIKRDTLTEVWFKKDDQFWTPRAQVIIHAQSPVAGSNARSVIMSRLFSYLIEDALSEYSYDAELAGLSYDFGSNIKGLSLTIGGYNDKLHVLAEHVMQNIKSLEIKEDRLELMKEKMQQELANLLLEDPSMLSEYYLSYLLKDREFTISEQLAEVQEVSLDKLREHVNLLLSQLRYKILVGGNLQKQDALRIASMLEEILCAEAIPKKNLIPERSRLLPKSCNYIWELPVPNPDEVNSSVSFYCHVGSISDPQVRVVFRLLDRILREPTFDILRTKEQLGYVVMSTGWESVESLGWHALVLSEKDPKYVESCIEAFLVHMRSVLRKMKEEEFEEHKAALTHDWMEKLKHLGEETSRFWTHIHSGYLDFQRRERDAELIKSVSKRQVLDMFKEFLDPTSPSRSKLSVHMRSQVPPAPKLSERAADKFFTALQKVGVAVTEDEYDSLCEEMSVSEARDYWEEMLREKLESSHKTEKILAEFDRLVEKYPEEGYDPVELDSKVVFIKDAVEFRESLALSAVAKPVEEFEVE